MSPYWAQYLEQQEIGKPQDVVEQENHLSYLLQYPEIGKERIDARISEIVTEIRNAFDAEFTPTEEEKKEKNRRMRFCIWAMKAILRRKIS